MSPSRPKPVPCLSHKGADADTNRLAALRSLGDYLSRTDHKKRPPIVAVHVYFRLKISEVEEDGTVTVKHYFNGTRHSFSAFAFREDLLFTTRHGFETPTLSAVEWEADLSGSEEEAVEVLEGGGEWEYYACFANVDDGNSADKAKSGLTEYTPVRMYYKNTDIIILKAREESCFHHTVGFASGYNGQSAYLPDVSRSPVMLWSTQIDHFNDSPCSFGNCSFAGLAGLSGSPLVTLKGDVVGMFYGNRRLKRSNYQAGLFVGSAFLVKFYLSMNNIHAVSDLKPGSASLYTPTKLRLQLWTPFDGQSAFPRRFEERSDEEETIHLISDKLSDKEMSEFSSGVADEG